MLEPEGRFFERYWLAAVLWVLVIVPAAHTVRAVAAYPHNLDWARFLTGIAPLLIIWTFLLFGALFATRRARQPRQKTMRNGAKLS